MRLYWGRHQNTAAMKLLTLLVMAASCVTRAAANTETIKVLENTLWRQSFGNKGGASLVNASGIAATGPEFINSLTYCFRFNLQVLSGTEKEFFGILLSIGEW